MAPPTSKKSASWNPSQIKNKQKRTQVYAKLKEEKKKQKQDKKKKRKLETEELGEEVQPKQKPRTLDNTRELEITTVLPNDEEVLNDEATDEFAKYFSAEQDPKIMITTRPRPSKELFRFIQELMLLIPHAYYYPRKTYDIKEICKYAAGKKFTHLIVLSEKEKVCNGAIISHLPAGPTAFFKISNVVVGGDIKGHGQVTEHIPELILNNFTTRLGHRVGRLVGSLFPHVLWDHKPESDGLLQRPEFKGRQVATFHNQRDYIFVRHHRYVFDTAKKARLQELGPRFTMKLRWLQEGVFDTKYGEYEWIHKRKEMDTSRRKFHL